jgi:kynurenine formamidase
MSEYHLLNHIGTHVDAPSHQIAGGATLDEIPLESLVTDAVTLDLSAREPGAIGWSELEPLVADLHEGDWLFVYSDNGRNWGADDYWTGWSYPDADASRGLIERGIVGIGFDGPSADPVDTETFVLHKVWLGAGRMILENLTNLGLLPARAQVVVAPLKVRAANGAPARVLAFVPD